MKVINDKVKDERLLLQFFSKNLDIASVTITICDIAGSTQGKRMPISAADKVFNGGARMPLSVIAVDIWDQEVYGCGLIFETGDADGALVPTSRGLLPVTRTVKPSALPPAVIHNEDGTPFMGDPCNVLEKIVGLIVPMLETMIMFAPHMNSYRRICPGCHATVSQDWGYENRTTAIRIPERSPSARRIEHRVAGADANPYLVLSSILGEALYGIEEKLMPPPETTGDAHAQNLPLLPYDWASSVADFEYNTYLESV